jgi:hypothetical protein
VGKPDEVSDPVWKDWLTHRQKKRATVTGTVLKTLTKQAQLAGMALEDVLVLSIAQGWAGFRADWVKGRNSSARADGPQDYGQAGVS